MSPSIFRSALAAGCLLCCSSAFAQDLGLDLSDGPDLRPTLAVLGIGAPATVAPADKARADKLTVALVAASKKIGWFSKVLEPAECAAKLGEGANAALACESAECLADLARQLGVDRVLSSQIEFPADGPNLKLSGLDSGTNAIEVVDVLSQGKGATFERNVAQNFKGLLQKLSTSLGTLKVVPSEPNATVEVGGRVIGTGTAEKPAVEKAVAAGTLKVRVTAPDCEPFETEVALEAKATATVEAKLAKKLVVAPNPAGEAPPIEVAKPAAPSTPFYKRGGLYTGVVGLAALAVGIVYGVKAKDLENKAKPVDGVSPITRAQRQMAIDDARISTILMSAGGAVTAGGVLWFILEPAPSMPGKEKEPGGPKSEPTPVGFLLTIGGEI